MGTVNLRLYDIFRKDLKLQEAEAKELVEVIHEVVKEEVADKHKHIEQIVQKDIKHIAEHMDQEFGRMREYMRQEFSHLDTKFATKEELANLKADLSKTIYFTSLAQLIAIIASVISLVLILKK
ncbi:hypothetical protein D3H65_12400 [Paraflavitalea soli]|uniref:DUF1640 domain-containing protein n=1 Tax=Paraflavitalea soli TaxID=2315862 RepID=A0A3B7MJV1_9BACT|nr:hypothetical protein [Paraflavitalea soli]AXY74734.1 hypothetical protein D3H65_12400 [Paraflavitalea soli]